MQAMHDLSYSRARLLRSCLLLGTLIGLTACGFQLRGVGGGATLLPESWKSMHLAGGNPNSELNREVRTRLAANGIVWQERAAANYRLVLGSEEFRQQNLSLNSEARAAEYELTMSTHFTVYDSSNVPVIEESTASVVKQMENDPRNVVGKAEEIRLLRNEMRGELAQQILRRIGFFASAKS